MSEPNLFIILFVLFLIFIVQFVYFLNIKNKLLELSYEITKIREELLNITIVKVLNLEKKLKDKE